MVKKIYEIFCDKKNKVDRKEELKKIFEQNYEAKQKGNKEEIWRFSEPFIDRLVEKEFKPNIIADCASGSCNGGSRVFTHLEDKIEHNDELIVLILSLAKIWDESIAIYSDRACRALDTSVHCDNTIINYINENSSRLNYHDWAAKISRACWYRSENCDSDLVNDSFYNYLYIEGIDYIDNSTDITVKKVSIKRVIIW